MTENNPDLTVGITTFFGSFDTMEDYRVFNPTERALKSVKKSIEVAKNDPELAGKPPKVEIIVSVDNMPENPGKVSSLFNKTNIITPLMLDLITESMGELGINDPELLRLIGEQKTLDAEKDDFLKQYPNKNIKTEIDRRTISLIHASNHTETIDDRKNAQFIINKLQSLSKNEREKLFATIYKKNLDRVHKTIANFQDELQKDPDLKNSVSFKVLESTTNTGVSGNRNAILENAKGNHLLFIDEDNKMTNMAVAKTIKLSREDIKKNEDEQNIAFDLNSATNVDKTKEKKILS